MERDWYQIHKLTDDGRTGTRRTARSLLDLLSRDHSSPGASQFCVLTGTLLPNTGLAAHHPKVVRRPGWWRESLLYFGCQIGWGGWMSIQRATAHY